MKKNITIAIDGYSSCGKSTLAKELAKELNYTYVDSGAMYRAVSYYFLKNKLDFTLESNVDMALENIKISFEQKNGKQITLLNGVDVEDEIRGLEVSNIVSEVARISKIRSMLVQQQRALRTENGLLMDGRDIGTVVFPDAELKIFLTASIEVRTERRYQELLQKGIKTSREEVAKNLQKRDDIDSTRLDSPLRKAEDAILIDNSMLTKTEQLNHVLALVYQITLDV